MVDKVLCPYTFQLAPRCTEDPRASGTSGEGVEPLLTAHEVARMLGVNVAWVYERTRRDAVPYVRIGRYVRFRRPDVEAWVQSGQASAKLGALPEPNSRSNRATRKRPASANGGEG